MRRELALACLFSLGLAPAVAAQRAQWMFVRWEPTPMSSARTGLRTTSQPDSTTVRQRDYRYEGLVFGSVALGALGAWVGSQIRMACPTVPGARCDRDAVGNGVALGLLGAAAGGGLGYLVGRISPKPFARDSVPLIRPSPALTTVSDSVRRRVGYQHWRGTGIGLGTGGVVGALTGAILGAVTVCDDCPEQHSPGWGALRVGLLGAGAGGVVGFLVGLSSPKYVWVPQSSLPQ
jgi:hypothetical protein